MEVKKIKQTKSVKAILSTAKILFWKHGLKRISVEELCEKAKVSKMTFYRNFANKYEVMGHLLKEQIEGGISSYEKIMCMDLPYPDKIVELVAFKQMESKEVSMELMKEIYSGDEDYHELKHYISSYQQEFMLRLRSDFLKAQSDGFIRSDLKIDFVLYMLNMMQQQMSDPALISLFSDVSELSNNLTKVFFYGILKQ